MIIFSRILLVICLAWSIFHFVKNKKNVACAVEVGVTAETAHLDFGDSVRLQAFTTLLPENMDAIYWEPADRLSCTNCFSPWAAPFKTTTYSFTVVDHWGCESTSSITLTVDRTGGVYIPNAFSPNGDGFNDFFTIYGGSSVSKINELRIFDRWGEMVYLGEDFPPNEPALGWNGNFRNEDDNPMHAAVFAFWTTVEFIDGTSKVFKGDLTLVR